MDHLIFGFICTAAGAAVSALLLIPAAVQAVKEAKQKSFREGAEAVVPALHEWHAYGLAQGRNIIAEALAQSPNPSLSAAGALFVEHNPKPEAPRPKRVRYGLVMGPIEPGSEL